MDKLESEGELAQNKADAIAPAGTVGENIDKILDEVADKMDVSTNAKGFMTGIKEALTGGERRTLTKPDGSRYSWPEPKPKKQFNKGTYKLTPKDSKYKPWWKR